ncbi:MAG: hypothetical protein ACUVRQ_05610 [Thermoanaerobaculaceae bacterium]
MVILCMALLLASGTVRLELPPQLALEPIAPEELASATAQVWEGEALPAVPVVKRKVSGAFRLTVPPGDTLPNFEVSAALLAGGNLREAEKGSRIPLKVTVLPLRLVASGPEGNVYEGDLVLYLDVSRALAGKFMGLLELSVVGR